MSGLRSRAYWLVAILCAVMAFALLPAVAQESGYTIEQITFGNEDHRWPSINNHGEIVWCQQYNGRWHVFKRPSGQGAVQKITDGDNHHRYPVISDNGDIVYIKYGVGAGVGRRVIKHPDTVIEFSSRDIYSTAHRDAGEHFGIASDGTIISYYDWYPIGMYLEGRRLNVSGIGRVTDNFEPGDYPDINKDGAIVCSYFGQTYRMTTSNHTPIPLAAAEWPRINDQGDVVAIAGARVEVYSPPDYGVGTFVHTGLWADINNKRDVVFEDFDQDGKRQIFLATNTPDLVALRFSYRVLVDTEDNGPLPVNARFAVNAEILNQGADAGAFTIRFYISPDDTIDPTDTPIGMYRVPLLAAGARYPIDPRDNFAQIDMRRISLNQDKYHGSVWIGMVIDADHEVTESEEGEHNNANQGDTKDRRNTVLYDPIFQDTELALRPIRRTFPIYLRAALYLMHQGFFIYDPFSHWSKRLSGSPIRSWFNNHPMPSNAFRIQAGISDGPPYSVSIQGGFAWDSRGYIIPTVGEPAPEWAFLHQQDEPTWYFYVIDYHRRF